MAGRRVTSPDEVRAQVARVVDMAEGLEIPVDLEQQVYGALWNILATPNNMISDEEGLDDLRLALGLIDEFGLTGGAAQELFRGIVPTLSRREIIGGLVMPGNKKHDVLQ